MIEVGDIVKFIQVNDEIYPYKVPRVGNEGIVRLVTFNVGLMQLLGVELPMCLVSFPKLGDIHIYTEDLKLVEKGNKEDPITETSLNDHIN